MAHYRESGNSKDWPDRDLSGQNQRRDTRRRATGRQRQMGDERRHDEGPGRIQYG